MLSCQELYTSSLIWVKENQAKCQRIVCSIKILKKLQVPWMPKRCSLEDLKIDLMIESLASNNRNLQLKQMSTSSASQNLQISLAFVIQV